MLRVALPLLALAFAAGCSSTDVAGGPRPLPPLASAALTTERTIVPSHPVDATASRSPSSVANLAAMLGEGYGATTSGPGSAIVRRNIEGADPGALPAGSQRIARFVHLADTQLADDESPARVARLDNPSLGGGAFRPQEQYGCVLLRAAVRTINAVDRTDPLDAVILGGDNADNAQQNEIDWFLASLAGAGPVHCDSGADDDPVPGPDNDPKDPLATVRLARRWLWVTGNHDILNQGTIRTDVNASEPVGTLASVGTRDWSSPGGPIKSGDFVVADPRRAYLSRASLMARVASDEDGHGLGAAQRASGRADYTFDLTPTVRLVALDTAAETGSSEGVLRAGVLDGFLKPALERAKADGKLVIVTSHHASTSLTDGSQTGGTRQPDAITTPRFRELLSSYPNVVMHLAAHSHENSAEPIAGTFPYWEVKSPSLMDFPNQVKLYELWRTPEGSIVVRGVDVDFATDDDPLAKEARAIAVTDFTCGYTPDGRGTANARNVELWLPKR